MIPWGLEGKRFSLEKRMLLGIGFGLWGGLIVSIQLLKHISTPLCMCCGADARGSPPMEEQSDSGICAVSPGGGFCFEVPTLAVG